MQNQICEMRKNRSYKWSDLLMQSLFMLAFLALPLAASAHDDWRTDQKAFESARVDEKRYTALHPTPSGNTNNEEVETQNAFGQVFRTRIPIVITEAEFREKLEQLTGIKEVQIHGQWLKIPERGSTKGRTLAREWLAQEYAALGFKTTIQKYGNGDGANFLAKKDGTSPKMVILSSHIDSVNNAGADDDGSGTIAALLISKALKNLNNVNTLAIAGFDQEELGLYGSMAFASAVDKTMVLGDIHMEMMAYNSRKDGHFHVIDCDRADSQPFTAGIMQSIQALGLPLTRVAACTTRSDHGAFWKYNMPAVVLSENFFGGDGDKCYHQKCDVLDQRLDLNYAAKIATGLANALPRFLGSN